MNKQMTMKAIVAAMFLAAVSFLAIPANVSADWGCDECSGGSSTTIISNGGSASATGGSSSSTSSSSSSSSSSSQSSGGSSQINNSSTVTVNGGTTTTNVNSTNNVSNSNSSSNSNDLEIEIETDDEDHDGHNETHKKTYKHDKHGRKILVKDEVIRTLPATGSDSAVIAMIAVAALAAAFVGMKKLTARKSQA